MKPSTLALLLLIVLTGIFSYWLYLRLQPAPVEPVAVTGGATEAGQTEPVIANPVDAIAVPDSSLSSSAELELPPLSESDSLFENVLTETFGEAALLQYFQSENFADRLVTTIDNLPGEKLAQKFIPANRVEGELMVTETETGLYLAAENHDRYSSWINLLQGVDRNVLLAYYVRYYPLFQQAYERLGRQDVYFNDRLVEVIQHLLATPEVAGPVALIKPEASYQFADPDLEALSVGQKILLRMGSENAAVVRQELSALLELIRQPAQQGLPQAEE